MALRDCVRPIIGGHHGAGIHCWIDRVVSHHGLSDLCVALAGEILVLSVAPTVVNLQQCEN